MLPIVLTSEESLFDGSPNYRSWAALCLSLFKKKNPKQHKNPTKTTRSFLPQRQVTSLSLVLSTHCNLTRRQGSISTYIAFSFSVLLSERNTSIVALRKHCEAGTMVSSLTFFSFVFVDTLRYYITCSAGYPNPFQQVSVSLLAPFAPSWHPAGYWWKAFGASTQQVARCLGSTPPVGKAWVATFQLCKGGTVTSCAVFSSFTTACTASGPGCPLRGAHVWCGEDRGFVRGTSVYTALF